MATKKTTKTRSLVRRGASSSLRPLPPYGDPIRGAIAQGDPAAMRQMAVAARAWIASTEKQLTDAKKALTKLEAVLKKL